MRIFTSQIRVLLIFVVVFFFSLASNAQVSITMPSGGQNISVNSSSAGATPTYTPIGNIVIADNAIGDFGTGSNRIIRFNAPATWRFNTTGVSVIHSGTDISASSVATVTASYITIRYTATTAVASNNSLTISGVTVQSTSTAVGVAANIVTATNGTNPANVAGMPAGTPLATLTKVAAAYTKLQILLPGNTAAPGSATGRTGTATPQNAGSAFAVTVNAVDAYWNIVSSAPADEIQISSTFNGVMPANNNLSAGSRTFNVTLNQSGTNRTVTATNITDGTKTANTSGPVTITAGAFSRMLITLPGQTYAPGSATGNTGTPTVTAGTAFSVTVRSVDNFFNLVSSTNTVRITATGATNATLPANLALQAGVRTFTNGVTLRKAGENPTLTATNVTDGAKTPSTSPSIIVNADIFTKLQILLPGETAAPGTASGKTGTPTTPYAANTVISVIVNAVDANWNMIATVNDVVGITSSIAGHAGLPPNAALSAGSGSFNVTLTAAGAQTLTATDITNSAKAANTSPSFTVNSGAFVKLLAILPGEIYAPGSLTGKTGTPTAVSPTANFTVVVRGVDANWNTVITANDIVTLTTTDPYGTITTNGLQLVNGVRSFTTVRLRTAGNTHTITATYTNDLLKTPYTTAPITVVAGPFTKLQILVPGETADPGSSTGKTGTPTAQTAGIAFPVTVNAVDASWNVVNTVTDVVGLTSTDPNAPMPANTALTAGTITFNVTLTTASTTQRRITATDITDNSKTANTSPASPNGILVNPGAFAKLLVVLPGETYAPGTPTGKTGTPANQGVNVAFNVAVRAVDNNWNLFNTVGDNIRITSSDVAAVLPANAVLVNGVKTNFVVRLNTPGNQTITATDLTDGTKTAYTTGNILVVAPTNIADFFRSAVANGDWNNSSSWESSPNGTTLWQPATLSPTSASNVITVRTGNTINIVASVTVDQVAIENGGQVNANGGTLTIANGADAFDFVVNGILSSRTTITTTGAVQVSSTGRYIHAFTGTGNVPTATWDAGSIVEINALTNFTGIIGNTAGQTFSDVLWNAPSQSASASFTNGTVNTRSFTVLSTGTATGIMNFTAAGGTVNIGGDFYQSAGTVAMAKASGAATVKVNGNVNLVGGTLTSGAGTGDFSFGGTGIQLYTRSGSTISGAINFAILPTSTVDFGTSIIDGSTGAFTLWSGGSLITANAGGIAATGTNTGTIQVGGSRTYNYGDYTYNGNVAQAAGTGLPTSVDNLTITNASGVTMPATSTTYSINGVLTINPAAGSLNMGTNILTGAFSNTGAGRLITAAADPFNSGKTWVVGVEYNSTSAQNIISGTYNNLLATSGAGVKTGPSGALNIVGNWSSAGGNVDLVTNNTPISFNGINQSLTAGNLLFQNVTFATSGTKTLTSGNFSVAETGTLTMANVATLNANGNLTLLSNASSSARIGSIPSGASITGNVTVQRFVTGGAKNPYRTWRMFSSPVIDGSLNQYVDDILITGAGGAGSGFDPSLGNAASAFGYNNGFVELTSLAAGGSPGRGVYMLYRGNRSDASNKLTSFDAAVDPESTVMDFIGTLNQGDVVVNGLSGTGVNLLGNPYASTINWMFINKTGLTNSTIRIWNPASRNYAVYDDGSISGAVSTNGGSQFIPAGQGFFVAQGTSLTFTEGAKDSAQPSTLLMSTPSDVTFDVQQSVGVSSKRVMSAGNNVVTAASPLVRLKLKKDSTPYSDEIVLSMKAGNSGNYVVNEDIVSFGTPEVSLASISSDNRRLAVNRLPVINEVSDIKLSIGGEASSKGVSKSGAYHLDVNYSNLPTDYVVQVKDNFTNTTTAVVNGGSYAFNVDETNVATTGNNRLSISFVPPTVLPVTLTSFTATKSTEGVVLKWSTSSELNNDGFVIERAGEDKAFKTLLTAKAKGPSSYQLVDKNPLMGNNYYQLKQIDKDGTVNPHNKIEVINFNGVKNAALGVYPNPVTDRFTLKYDGILTGKKQTVKIISVTGQTLLAKFVTNSELNNGLELNIATYAAGTYLVTIVDADNKQVDLAKLIKL